MKPQEIFDVCHGRYRSLREFLKGRLAAVNLDTPSDCYHWRPDRARAEEFCADYERIADRALSRPGWKGRRKLFHVYYLRNCEYDRAVTLTGVSPGTFDYWLNEVKKTLGREFDRAGLFPPGAYFRRRDIARVTPPEERRESPGSEAAGREESAGEAHSRAAAD
ncbi:MAG TPA: hypothetical protein VJN21_02320 [Candidatus Acidoferrales bacterium]|nr:hypothetical protein [Candidatus Acidoferrales bacterium]